jgi:predicted esterase
MGSSARLAALVLLSSLAVESAAAEPPRAGEPPAEEPTVPTRDLRVGKDEKKRWFLIGPKEGEKGPAGGFRVLLVMPGGDGGADFRPFVTRIRENALSKDWIVAQMVSVRWSESQEIVWPTEKNPVPGMKFSTEDFARDVLKDAARLHPVDEKKVFSLSWSSGGPAAYALALTEKSPVRGSYVAMSVWKPDLLPPLARAKGRRFLVEHSKEDRVCPFRMAEQARDQLEKAGAKVRFTPYDGGHGWHGDVFGRLKDGLAWLADEER